MGGCAKERWRGKRRRVEPDTSVFSIKMLHQQQQQLKQLNLDEVLHSCL